MTARMELLAEPVRPMGMQAPFLAVILVVVLLLAACTNSAERPENDARSTPNGAASGPTLASELTPPSGTRWLGVRDVILAVPRGWNVTQNVCSREQSIVLFVPSLDLPKCSARADTRATLRIYQPKGSTALRGLKPFRSSDALRMLASSLRCRTSMPPICSMTIAVPGKGVGFAVTYHGEPKLITAMRDSLRSMPDDFIGVPPVPLGWSGKRAQQHLRSFGLEGRAPEVDLPHYVTGTKPEAGTVLRQGTVVEFTIGDG